MSSRSLWTQPSLHVLMAVASGLLVGWPIIEITGARGHWAVYLYVFAVWLLMLLILALIGHAIVRAERTSAAASDVPPHRGD